MAKKIDRIAQMFNCPVKGEELRRGIIESRKEFLLNKQEADIPEEDTGEDEVLEEGDEEDDDYDEFDWTTE